MKPKQLLTMGLLVFVAISVIVAVVKQHPHATPSPETSSETSEATVTTQKHTIEPEFVVYYFHRTARCMTCNTIEEYTRTALQASFAETLNEGQIQMLSLNYELPLYEHFIQDFGLTANSVVLARMQDGEIAKWKNLDQIWTLVRQDQAVYEDYIHRELMAFMEGTS